MLAECHSFYSKLYAENVNAHSSIDLSDFFGHENDTILHEKEQNSGELW